MPEETVVQVQDGTQEKPTAAPAGASEPQAVKAAAGTFTQEQVDKFAGLAREEGRNAATRRLLESLGVKSVDDLTSIVQSYRKEEQEKLSEVEKARKELAKVIEEQNALKRENVELKLMRMLDDTTRELNLKFVNEKARSDALLSIERPADGWSESFDMKSVVKKILEERPYLFDKTEAPKMDAVQKGASAPGALTEERISELKKRFRIK